MKRELGIARCGLACCLCSENVSCQGCDSGQCPDKDWCENRKCSIEKDYSHCYSCCNEEYVCKRRYTKDAKKKQINLVWDATIILLL